MINRKRDLRLGCRICRNTSQACVCSLLYLTVSDTSSLEYIAACKVSGLDHVN